MNLNAAHGLFLHEAIHVLISLGVAFFVVYLFKDKRLGIIAFLIGVFIDLDHWFDYFAWNGWQVNLRNFFDVSTYIHPAGKVYIPLHGWEWLPIFWLTGKLIGRKIKMKGLEWAISLAVLGHLLWDNFCFYHHPLSYSFFFRLLTNFSLKKFDGF